VDVTDDATVRAGINGVVAEFGRAFDILINNAGIGAARHRRGQPDEQWRHVFDVNCSGTPLINE